MAGIALGPRLERPVRRSAPFSQAWIWSHSHLGPPRRRNEDVVHPAAMAVYGDPHPKDRERCFWTTAWAA